MLLTSHPRRLCFAPIALALPLHPPLRSLLPSPALRRPHVCVPRYNALHITYRIVVDDEDTCNNAKLNSNNTIFDCNNMLNFSLI